MLCPRNSAADYDKVKEADHVAVLGLKALAPGKNLTMVLTHADKSTETIELLHSCNSEQVDWFKAGSALNLMRSTKR